MTKEIEVKETPTVKYSTLNINQSEPFKTFIINDYITEGTLTNFSAFLNEVREHNKKIDVELIKHKEHEQFNKVVEDDAKKQFLFQEKKIERINLIINSYGGMCSVMHSVVALMKSFELPIDTYCFGAAVSAGFYIYIHGKRR